MKCRVHAVASKPPKYWDPVRKADEPETYEYLGHRWLKTKPECRDCGLRSEGVASVAWTEQSVEKYTRRGVTYYGDPPPKCDPGAKR